MRYIIPIILVCLMSGCFHYPKTPRAQIETKSAPQLEVGLSQEDLSVLQEHHPKLLQKIWKKRSFSIEDVCALHELGVEETSIISILEHTNSVFKLTTKDIVYLQEKGVAFVVIHHMLKP